MIQMQIYNKKFSRKKNNNIWYKYSTTQIFQIISMKKQKN